jgi:hypothetical protein
MRGIITASMVSADLLFEGRPFERADADEAGLTQHDVTELLNVGALRQVIRGVYLDARVPDDLASRAASLRLRLPPDAVVCRLTAAWLWGVDGRGPEQLGPVEFVECVVPPGRQPLCHAGVRSYVAPLTGDTCLAGGVPATTPVRTAIDVLRWLAPHMGLAIADALTARGLATPEAIRAHVEDFPARRGIRQARYLASLIEPRTESFGESWLRLRIIDAGFPRPSVQIEVMNASGDCIYRLDLGWEHIRLAVEYDGEQYHSSAEQLDRDRRRRDDLERTYGWRVFGVGRGEVLGSSLALEWALGDLLNREPQTRRRRW